MLKDTYNAISSSILSASDFSFPGASVELIPVPASPPFLLWLLFGAPPLTLLLPTVFSILSLSLFLSASDTISSLPFSFPFPFTCKTLFEQPWVVPLFTLVPLESWVPRRPLQLRYSFNRLCIILAPFLPGPASGLMQSKNSCMRSQLLVEDVMIKTASLPGICPGLRFVWKRIVSDSISRRISERRSHLGCSSNMGWIVSGSQAGLRIALSFPFLVSNAGAALSSSSRAAQASSSSASTIGGERAVFLLAGTMVLKHRRFAMSNITFAASVSNQGDWCTRTLPEVETVLDWMMVSR